MLPDVALIVPTAVALATTGTGDFDNGQVVVLAGQNLRPGLASELQLRDQQPIAKPIDFVIPIAVEPAQGRLQFGMAGFDADSSLEGGSKLLPAAAVFDDPIHGSAKVTQLLDRC